MQWVGQARPLHKRNIIVNNPTPPQTVTTLFLDLGGVLLTNGWGRTVRKNAAEKFQIDYTEMDERHHLSFNTYEDGKLTLDQYLDQVVFYVPRSFTKEAFRAFMYEQSQPFPEMLNLIRTLKARYHLKIVVVSNEGRELTDYRIDTFKLREFVDAFVVSSYVHFRKPDRDIYSLALDIAQTKMENAVYVDDRLLFIEVARGMGIYSIRHVSLEDTAAQFATLGLT